MPLAVWGFPLTEGWWETFGYLINSGYVPYRDFNIPVSPAFAYLTALLLKAFGVNFFALRLFGVALVSITALLTYVLAFQWTRNAIVAFGAAVLTSALHMADVVYIAKDYHSTQNFLTIVALLLFWAIVNRTDMRASSKAPVITLLALGVVMGIMALTKINVAVFMSIAIVLSLATLARSPNRLLAPLVFVAGIAIVAIAFLVLTGVALHVPPIEVIAAIREGSESKGSVVTVLTRVFQDPINRHVLTWAALIAGVAAVLIIEGPVLIALWLPGREATAARGLRALRFGTALTPLLIVLFAGYGLSRIGSGGVASAQTIPVVSLALFFLVGGIRFCRLYQGRAPRVVDYMLLPLAALGYCTTHTASFNNVGLFFVNLFSFSLAGRWLCRAARHARLWSPKNFSVLLLACYLSFLPAILLDKYGRPYAWWGLQLPPMGQINQFSTQTAMSGIRMDRSTRDALDDVLAIIKARSRSRGDIYAFPNIPIFYLLAGKQPPTANLVQWFDVVTSAQLQTDLQFLKEGNPSVIVALLLPDFVFEGHSKLIRRPLLQRDMYAILGERLIRGDFQLCYAKYLGPIEPAEEFRPYSFVGLKSGHRQKMGEVVTSRFTTKELLDVLDKKNAFPVRLSDHVLVALCRD
ncbi:MAG: hypothetical protein EPO20_00425 [Betaproteobacteria bacterium]|nr:MAG: hypothetical protein EPO20_00425 [Betaproteobacteria bacterium]